MDTLQLNELLECSVCLERLEHNCKVLPCQHTFCLRCLRQIVASRKELRCPECRILVTEDVDDLPTNILLVRILEGLKRQKEIKRKDIDHEDKNSTLTKEDEEGGTMTFSQEPSARALYDYEPKEQGDLVLKKGQTIELLRQVDVNWYEGRIGDQQGFLPANYVEILVPLPNFDDSINQGPVARALYDFEDPEEKDLLSFKQGEIIQVIRRVDENWCEGRIDNLYGIFPINFVEFNDAARSIVFSLNSDLSCEAHWDQAVQVRPSRRPKTIREVKRHTVHGGERQQIPKENGSNMPNRHSVDVTCSERFNTFCNHELVSSQSLNNITNSEQTTSRLEGHPSSIPTPAQEEDPLNLGRVLSVNHSRQSSKESPPSSSHSRQSSDELVLENNNATASSSDEHSLTRASGKSKQDGSEERKSTSLNSSKQNSSDQRSPPLKSRHSSSSDSSGTGLYIALYNYKSQKEDELDLVQGEKYQVIDKCRDGWFKGRSVKTHKSGVFPGNYVKLSRSPDSVGISQQASASGVSSVNGQSSSSSVPNRRRSVPTPPNLQRSPPAVARRQKSDLSDASYNIVAPNERLPSQLPPPPPAMRPSTSGSASFFKKLGIGKRKERGRPIMPPPPPYQRHPTSSNRQEGSNISLFGPSPNVPPPPYSSRSTAGQLSRNQSSRSSRQQSSTNRERCRVVVAYPPQSSSELELRVGDIVYVFKKHEDGWYRGTLERNGKTGLFPGSFVEKF